VVLGSGRNEEEILIYLSNFYPPTNSDKLSEAAYQKSKSGGMKHLSLQIE